MKLIADKDFGKLKAGQEFDVNDQKGRVLILRGMAHDPNAEKPAPRRRGRPPKAIGAMTTETVKSPTE